MRRSALPRPDSLTDRYRILGKIGEGTYGTVFKAESHASTLESTSPNSGDHIRKDNEINPSLPASSFACNSTIETEKSTFAIKVVKSHKEGKNDVVLSSATIREIKLLRELQHENIVYLHDVYVDPTEKALALVFEYADHDLHNIIVQSKQQTSKPMSEYTRKSIMYQILKGVDYIHDAWVMHRDMKPQNILVVGHGKKRGQVKLADFGLARLYKEPIKALSEVERVVVTLWYRAPELLLGAKHYTKAVDMWAVGCIFGEIINARELFCGKEVEGSNAPFQKDQCDKIFRVLGMPTAQNWEGLEHLSEFPNVLQMARERKYPSTSDLRNAVKFGAGPSGLALYDLLSRLLEYDPEVRITAKQALQHDYFTRVEPGPRDWSFDEPGREPISFRTQTVEPVSDDQLPWKPRKDVEVPVIESINASSEHPNITFGESNRGRSNSRNRSQAHSGSRGDSVRRDRKNRNTSEKGIPLVTTGEPLISRRDRSSGRNDRERFTSGGHYNRAEGRSRSPKQQRRR